MVKITTFLLFSILIFQINSFAQIPVESKVNLAKYDALIHEVRATFARGEERTAEAVERVRVQTYWEVGKLIDEHILLHQERAEYGKEVIKRLSGDLGISVTEIQYMVQFARAYSISPHAGKLSWSEYRDLLSVNDENERNKLAEQTVKNNWPRETLRREIKKIKAENPDAVSDDLNEEPLIPVKGKLDTYRIIVADSEKWQGKPVIDLGFSNYYRPEKLTFKEGDIVHSKAGKLKLAKQASASDLYTYRASVLEVTDGDTLWLWIDLGFGFFTKQQVRFRAIDAPEIVTRDGQAAKEFIEKELKHNSEVVITTSKSDKYDRYLVDIFYETKSGEKFLNNQLLEEGLASRV